MGTRLGPPPSCCNLDTSGSSQKLGTLSPSPAREHPTHHTILPQEGPTPTPARRGNFFRSFSFLCHSRSQRPAVSACPPPAPALPVCPSASPPRGSLSLSLASKASRWREVQLQSICAGRQAGGAAICSRVAARPEMTGTLGPSPAPALPPNPSARTSLATKAKESRGEGNDLKASRESGDRGS